MTMVKCHIALFDTGLSRTGRRQNRKQPPQYSTGHEMHNAAEGIMCTPFTVYLVCYNGFHVTFTFY